MTKREREQIYRRAAEMIFCGRSTFCCDAIVFAMQDMNIEYWFMLAQKSDFEELYMFDPKHKKEGLTLWWKSGSYEPRILALLFCAQMCKSK
jgi:hypothetical protein